MALKYVEKTIREVDYSDLDDFIKEEYGQDFECVADQEWSNHMSRQIDVRKEEIDKDDLEEIEIFKSTGKYEHLLRELLTDLCNKDKIEPAEYIIKIFW